MVFQIWLFTRIAGHITNRLLLEEYLLLLAITLGHIMRLGTKTDICF